MKPLDVPLDRIDRFPEHVWLVPEPRQRFLELIEATAGRFPDFPPYSGLFDGHVPHVTIASGPDRDAHFQAANDEPTDRLPIHDRASAVTLFQERDGRWRARASFAIGGA